MDNFYWHTNDVENVMRRLVSCVEGIGNDEAKKRLLEYGPNELIEKKKKTPLMMFIDQFKDFMILILIAAAVISGFIGELSDTLAIIVIVVINAIIGFVQEYRAEKAMDALKKMAAYTATVVRDRVHSTIAASELVPGDIVVLEAGRIVPADIRLVETANLKVEEAALTGESVSVEKHCSTLSDASLSLGDRKNMVFKGTVVSYGRGLGIVVATGMKTELGKIASMLQGEEEVKTPLQKRLVIFGKKLAIAVLAICAIVFGFGVLRGEPILLMLLTAISLAVAAIPEALPAVVTISLALGAKKLVKLNALIRKLSAVETLGSVTYICSDKTGTLTLNKMTVEQIYIENVLVPVSDIQKETFSETSKELILTAFALNNDAQIDAEGNAMGDPTETALYDVAKRYGYDKRELEVRYPRISEIPFDSERKCMTTFHKWKEGYISFTKGAIDVLLEKSVNIQTSNRVEGIDIERLQSVNEHMAKEGLRILCTAYRTWDAIPKDFKPKNVEDKLTVLGLAGMMDPPRDEAKEAVYMCKQAGITPVMITGDHQLTAMTIAKRLGILDDDSGAVITGKELYALKFEEFEEKVENIRVYARVAPEQKLMIVKALQDKGHFVAMTGDGVNDAPALKRSDIGVAMGITGTDVSKEAAHMILLDDNFATIVKAVKEGRKIYDNIRKFIKYLLTTNSGELWTLFLAPIFGLPIPLLPIHILWINLVTDGLPALALSVEPAEGDVMNRPPRKPKESIFAHGLGFHAIWVGLLMGIVVLLVQTLSIKIGNTHWQTMVFTVLCLTQLGHVLAIRSERVSLFKMGLFSNKYLFGAVLLTFVLQMATIYLPSLNKIFKTEPLSFGELLFTLILSSVVFFAVEIEKLIKRRMK